MTKKILLQPSIAQLSRDQLSSVNIKKMLDLALSLSILGMKIKTWHPKKTLVLIRVNYRPTFLGSSLLKLKVREDTMRVQILSRKIHLKMVE